MARKTKRLSARAIASLAKPGRHSDGEGLYLVVDTSGAKRWAFIFRWGGKLKEMGLGGLSAVSLADARERAGEARRCLGGGSNPIEVRRAAEAARQAATSFGAFADGLVEHLSQGFRNEEHQRQWAQTLKTYAAPLRDMPIDAIQTADILSVLTPIWQSKHVTASRVRGRIERVLDAATAKGLRRGENPARWRGHLDHLLSARPKVAQRHHAAMPYTEVPALMAQLSAREGAATLALAFCILNASRSGEVLGATWAEIDRKGEVWTIPATRMKGGVAHRVPLSFRALEFLDAAETLRTGDYVFPGRKSGRPLSHMALDITLRRIKVEGATVHGFRSSFRDWAGEATNFPREVAEAALAHVVGDATERAYRRGDALEKRRKLMDTWAAFVTDGASRAVVQLRRSPAN